MSENTTAKAGFRTYIGLRYVPKIMGVWSEGVEYEALSIVLYEGNSYTSKMIVPVGVDIHNENYWVMTGNYNVQVANLQNEVEVAVRQILNYATDFETFKRDMRKLYDDYVVDADGKVADKVEEFETEIRESYKAFQSYVTRALEEYKSDFDTFTEATQKAYKAFMNEANNKIANALTTITQRQANFETKLNLDYTELEDEVNNLVLHAGNPQSSSAEIVAARGNYPTLGARLNGMEDMGAFKHVIAVDATGKIDLNVYNTIGYYVYNGGVVHLVNAPVQTAYEFVVFTCENGKTAVQTFYNIIKPDKSDMYIENIYNRVCNKNGVWSKWWLTSSGNNTMIINQDTEPIGTLDFNHATAVGFTFYTADHINNYLNAPDTLVEPTDFLLENYRYSNGNERVGLLVQKCIFGASNEVWVRQLMIDVWTEWTKLGTDADFTGLVQRVTALENKTERLESNLDGTNQTVTNLSEAMFHDNQRITANANQIAGLNSNLNIVSGKVEQNSEDIAEDKASITSINANLDNKANAFVVTQGTVSLETLGSAAYTSAKSIYTIPLAANVLFDGQANGALVKVYNYPRVSGNVTQICVTEDGTGYARGLVGSTWSEFEKIVPEGGGGEEQVNTVVVHANTDFFVKMANKKTSIKFERGAGVGYKPTAIYDYSMTNKLADILYTPDTGNLTYDVCNVKCDGRDIDLATNQTTSGKVIGVLIRYRGSTVGTVNAVFSSHFLFKNDLEFERCCGLPQSAKSSDHGSVNGSCSFMFQFDYSATDFVYDGVEYTAVENLGTFETTRANSIIYVFTNNETNENYSISIKPSTTYWDVGAQTYTAGFVGFGKSAESGSYLRLPQPADLVYLEGPSNPAATTLFVVDIV